MATTRARFIVTPLVSRIEDLKPEILINILDRYGFASVSAELPRSMLN